MVDEPHQVREALGFDLSNTVQEKKERTGLELVARMSRKRERRTFTFLEVVFVEGESKVFLVLVEE